MASSRFVAPSEDAVSRELREIEARLREFDSGEAKVQYTTPRAQGLASGSRLGPGGCAQQRLAWCGARALELRTEIGEPRAVAEPKACTDLRETRRC